MARIKWNYKAFGDLMREEKIVDLLHDCADGIAKSAGNGFDVIKPTGGTRPRAYVAAMTFQAKRRQSKDHVLERSIDAGRR